MPNLTNLRCSKCRRRRRRRVSWPFHNYHLDVRKVEGTRSPADIVRQESAMSDSHWAADSTRWTRGKRRCWTDRTTCTRLVALRPVHHQCNNKRDTVRRR